MIHIKDILSSLEKNERHCGIPSHWGLQVPIISGVNDSWSVKMHRLISLQLHSTSKESTLKCGLVSA